MANRYSHSKDYRGIVPEMSHRHFAYIASVLNDLGKIATDQGQWLYTVRHVANSLKRTNPRFDELRFLEACGLGREASLIDEEG